LSLLIYGYATGCYSSSKIERAIDDALAFRYVACNDHPDHEIQTTCLAAINAAKAKIEARAPECFARAGRL
jgi:hypothetical protein